MDVLLVVLPVRAAVVRERARELRGEAAARERWSAVKRVAALEAMIAGYVSISVVVVVVVSELELSRERGEALTGMRRRCSSWKSESLVAAPAT